MYTRKSDLKTKHVILKCAILSSKQCRLLYPHHHHLVPLYMEAVIFGFKRSNCIIFFQLTLLNETVTRSYTIVHVIWSPKKHDRLNLKKKVRQILPAILEPLYMEAAILSRSIWRAPSWYSRHLLSTIRRRRRKMAAQDGRETPEPTTQYGRETPAPAAQDGREIPVYTLQSTQKRCNCPTLLSLFVVRITITFGVKFLYDPGSFTWKTLCDQ